MKIFVTVKQVPDTSGKVAVNPDGTLDRASMQTIINPDDLNAVEAALALKDELGCKVIAFTMGPPPAEGMLRELMAMGVDEGVLITAREFVAPIPTLPPRSSPLPSTPTASRRTISSWLAVRPSTVIPLRWVPRSLRSCICPRSPMPARSPRTATL